MDRIDTNGKELNAMASTHMTSPTTDASPAAGASPTTGASPSKDNADSLRRCAVVVACWCLAIGLLPPNGLLWQFGSFEGLGHWLVNGMLACLASIWARFDWTRSLVALFTGDTVTGDTVGSSFEGSTASDRNPFVAQN